MKTWLPLIPELKFRLFCCLWNSLGCLDEWPGVSNIEPLRVETCTDKRTQSVTRLGGALSAFEVLT